MKNILRCLTVVIIVSTIVFLVGNKFIRPENNYLAVSVENDYEQLIIISSLMGRSIACGITPDKKMDELSDWIFDTFQDVLSTNDVKKHLVDKITSVLKNSALHQIEEIEKNPSNENIICEAVRLEYETYDYPWLTTQK